MLLFKFANHISPVDDDFSNNLDKIDPKQAKKNTRRKSKKKIFLAFLPDCIIEISSRPKVSWKGDITDTGTD